MAITKEEQKKILAELVTKIFDENGLMNLVDGPKTNKRFTIDKERLRLDSPEVFQKDLAQQMLQHLQNVGMYARGKVLKDGPSQLRSENIDLIGNAIRAANGFVDQKEKNVFSLFGRDPKQPLGAVSDREYSDVSFLTGISEDELKRLVSDYRQKMGVDIAEASRLDAEANTRFNRVKMAYDFDNGVGQSGLEKTARYLFKYLSPNAYKKYIQQISEAEGSDDFIGGGREKATVVDAGVNTLQLAGPAGVGKAIASVPKVGGVATRVAESVGNKLATSAVGNQIASKGSYVLNPIYDMGVEAGAQLINDGEIDKDRLSAVGSSSFTAPAVAGFIGGVASKFTGPVRRAGREFNMNVKRGTSSSADARIDMRNDFERVLALKKQYETIGGAKKEIARSRYQAAVDDFNKKYPRENVQQAIDEGLLPNLIGVKPASFYDNPEIKSSQIPFTPQEEQIIGYREPTLGFFGTLGEVVSPASQQFFRVKSDSDRMSERYAEEERKRKEAIDKANALYRKWNFSYPALLADPPKQE